jgi:hypothetical protein
MYRSALEVVYVPVPSLLRRKTKTFIDSVVDSLGEGLGAGLVFLWVTALALPPRFLSLFIIAASFGLIGLSRRMGRQYFSTVAEQLQVSGERAETAAIGARLDSRDLLSGTFTRIDIRSLIDEAGGPSAAEAASDAAAEHEEPDADVTLARLNSGEIAVVARTLDNTTEWHESHLPTLCRLLARDPLVDRAVVALLTAGDPAIPHLAGLLTDDATDFVIRRRIPRVLARMRGPEAEDALLDALAANRFEVRYRAAIALTHRREYGHPKSERDEDSMIWAAIRSELGKSQPVWEMQKLLDEEPDDGLVVKRVGVRRRAESRAHLPTPGPGPGTRGSASRVQWCRTLGRETEELFAGVPGTGAPSRCSQETLAIHWGCERVQAGEATETNRRCRHRPDEYRSDTVR